MKSSVSVKSKPRKTSTVRETKSSSISTGLRELFIDELKDIYWAEKALIKSFPKMIKNASNHELKETLQAHHAETTGQLGRLEEVFESLDIKASAKKCEAMVGLIKEAEKIMLHAEHGEVRDAGIISAVQKIEHYEIASYGTLLSFAKTLGISDAISLLDQTLYEEKTADRKLTMLAEYSINMDAERSHGDGKENEGVKDNMHPNRNHSK